MAYYTRKPELIEAVQWTGDNTEEIQQFAIPFKVEEGMIGNRKRLFLLDQNEDYRIIWPNEYITKRDTMNSNLYLFEVMSETDFLERYQPDACDLDGIGCG